MDTIESLENAERLISNCDTSIFCIHSDTAIEDKRSLLILQNIVRGKSDHYLYLEIGSNMGGSLYPHIADVKCRLVYSIDKRPTAQMDERGRAFDNYCTTEQMISNLQQRLPIGAMLKLHAIDGDLSELSDQKIAYPCDLAFIDAEHTNKAVFKDFLNIRRFVKDSAIIAFHDAYYLGDALSNIEVLLEHLKIRFRSFVLPACVYVLLLGEMADWAGNVLERFCLDKEAFFAESKRALWKEIAKNNAEVME